jgi:hypothetical protein
MRIPFDIKYRPQIENGEYKVETKDLHPVRIICWDKNTGGLDRIVALVAGDSGLEKTLHYTEEGGWLVASNDNRNKDLIIVTPDEEMTPFEKGFLERVFHQKAEDLDEQNKEIFLEDARYILSLARKQLIKDGYSIKKKHILRRHLKSRIEYEKRDICKY